MELPPLTNGKILSRYKRFLADIELEDGDVITAHCPNTGAMTHCWQSGAPVQISKSDNPKRKLKWTLERVDMGAGWIGVNTNRTNHFIADFIRKNQILELKGYSQITTEPGYTVTGYQKSRFDLLLGSDNKRNCYVEIKNTTLFKDGLIQFPDTVTQRGKKHLELLQHAVSQGYRSVMLFAINRPEGDCFKVAQDIDPEYYQSLRNAYKNGVEILPLRIKHTRTGVDCGETLSFQLN